MPSIFKHTTEIQIRQGGKVMKIKNRYERIMKKRGSSKSKYGEKSQEPIEASCSITEGFQDLEINTLLELNAI